MSTAREIEEQVRKAVRESANPGGKMACELTNTTETVSSSRGGGNSPGSIPSWVKTIGIVVLVIVVIGLVWWFWRASGSQSAMIAGAIPAQIDPDLERRLTVLENNMARLIRRSKEKKHARD